MANVIFNRPVRFGKTVYPKSKRSKEVDDKFLKGKFVDALVEAGSIVIIAPKAAAAPVVPAPKK